MAYYFYPIIGMASPKVVSHKLYMQKLIFNAFILSLFGFLYGCTHPQPFEWPATTQRIVEHGLTNGFVQHEYVTSTFRLTTFEKLSSNNNDTVHVYIEGDGNSWKSRYVLSKNPTPKQPLALELAYRDTHPNVIYIARPCQYTSHQDDTQCSPKYWSSHRYSTEVITSFNETLDQIKIKTHNADFYVVGFSGGASVATLVANLRKDVSCLVTVAGDLNHDALSQHHRTSPLTGSLNPMNVTAQLKSLPQHHFSGEKDKVVPPWVAKEFAIAVDNPACVKVHTLKHVKHHEGWLEHAKEISESVCHC